MSVNQTTKKGKKIRENIFCIADGTGMNWDWYVKLEEIAFLNK